MCLRYKAQKRLFEGKYFDLVMASYFGTYILGFLSAITFNMLFTRFWMSRKDCFIPDRLLHILVGCVTLCLVLFHHSIRRVTCGAILCASSHVISVRTSISFGGATTSPPGSRHSSRFVLSLSSLAHLLSAVASTATLDTHPLRQCTPPPPLQDDGRSASGSSL